MSVMGSVVIPAHNEASVLAQTLDTLVKNLEDGEFEIVVVCNGCQDDSAEIARAFAPMVKVEEIDVASKVAALNHGDQHTISFPRVYLDADVRFSSESLRLVMEHLAGPSALASEPLPRIDLDGSSWLVKRWYAVWFGLHGGSPGRIGCGLFGLSRAARGRFGKFPGIIADDLFVRSHFSDDELDAVPGALSTVKAPRTLRDLIRIKTRSYLGSYELSQKFPELYARQANTRFPSRKPWHLSISLWPWIPFYAIITRYIRNRARGQYSSLSTYTWERDQSSRV